MVGQIRATPLMRRAIRYAIDLFTGFERETGHDPGFRRVGSLLLALTPERAASFEEHVERANNNGVDDSDRGVAMILGRTCLVTRAGREVLSAWPLVLIVV